MPSLRVLSNDLRETAREVAFTSDEMTIGREPDNVLVLGGAGVSRRHARILATSRGHLLVDADSANGVFVGQERVRHHFLASGTTFRIGEHTVEFRDEASVAATLLIDMRQIPLAPLQPPPASPTPTPALAPYPSLQLDDDRVAAQATGGALALCARCGAQRLAEDPACPQCGTNVRPRPRVSRRVSLWTFLFLGLTFLALALAALAYLLRDRWLPEVQRLVSPPATVNDVNVVAPELAEFGRFAKVRSADVAFGVGPGASSHALDETAQLRVPPGAFTEETSLRSSVVDLALERASGDVQSAVAYVVTAPPGTKLRQPIVVEIAEPRESVTVAEAYGDGWRPVTLPEGPTVRIPIDHFSRRTFAVVEWKDATKAQAMQAPAVMMTDGRTAPGLLGDTIDPGSSRTSSHLPPPVPTPYAGPPPPSIRDDPSYQRFTGAEPQAQYYPGRSEFCTVLTARTMGFPGLSFGRPTLEGKEVPRPEPGLPEGTPFEQLMIAAVDPASQDKNPYVRLTNDPPGDSDPRSRERRLEDAILASPGNLTPADIMEMSLRACDGNYMLASLTAHNLLKNIAYQGRQQGRTVAGLIARGRDDIHFPARYGDVASRLVNLRSGPGDKMGIWYHAFVPLAIAAWTDDPSEADWAITQEYVVRWLGSLTNMGSPMDPEKQASDRCFARSARDIRAQQALNSPPTMPPAPPPPPPPSPVAASPANSAGAGASPANPDAPCPPNPPVARKCPWTPDGYSVGLCGKGFCWDGGPQGALACKQEKDVSNSGRTYTSDLVCSDGFSATRDRCTNEILSCGKM